MPWKRSEAVPHFLQQLLEPSAVCFKAVPISRWTSRRFRTSGALMDPRLPSLSRSFAVPFNLSTFRNAEVVDVGIPVQMPGLLYARQML